MNWFEELYSKRIKWVETTRENNFEDGIRRQTIDKYTEPTHFVYELLQNAEDQRASSAWFKLENEQLTFGHDGSVFIQQDVVSITGYGNSLKPQSANKIGRFGVGFKSVFAVTDRPEVHSTLDDQPFSFAIEELVVPRMLNARVVNPVHKTLFVLPFRQGYEHDLYETILSKLRTLGADTMLFLDHLESIAWETEDEEGTYICTKDYKRAGGTCFTHLIEESGRKRSPKQCIERKYIQFHKKADIESSDRDLTVQAAFQLLNGEIVPEREGTVLNVYFPTEEKTGLKFRLHAPMLLVDSRAQVKREAPENKRLADLCGVLVAESLARLRDQGFLKVSALNCLPIEPERFTYGLWKPIYDAVREALRSQALLPTDSDGYIVASNARLAGADWLRKLVSGKQLGTLMGIDSACCWLASEISERKMHPLWTYLKAELGVVEETPESFATKLSRSFLTAQTDDWLIDLYGYLVEVPSLWRKGAFNPPLRANPERPLIRLEDGRMLPPYAKGADTPTVFLPPPHDTVFPVVKRSIFESEKARRFLDELGLRAPDIVDEMTAGPLKKLVEWRENIDCIKYEAELDKIASAIKLCRADRLPDLAKLLLGTPIVLVERAGAPDEIGLATAWEAYERSPQALKWFDGGKDAWIISERLLRLESWSVVKQFLAERQSLIHYPEAYRLGTHAFPDLQILKRKADSRGFVSLSSSHSNHSRGLQGFDPGATIEGLEFALKHPNVERAMLLWNMLLADPGAINGAVVYATHSSFDNAGPSRTTLSKLGKLCMESEWLPGVDGSLATPSELELGDLCAGIENDTPRAYALAAALGMRHSKVAEAAQIMGLPASCLAQVKEKFERDPAALVKFLETPPPPSFPAHESPNPSRRYEKIIEEAMDAPEKTYVFSSRSTRASPLSGSQKTYLRSLYTNEDDLFCQICVCPMPFRLDDGRPYFEAVQLIPDLHQEHYQNYIAVCPVCAAMYKHTNGSDFADMIDDLKTTPTLEISVILAREQKAIRFVKTHLQDVRGMLEGERQRSEALNEPDEQPVMR